MEFPVFPYHDDLAGIEDGRVRPTDDTDQQGEHERPNRLATEQIEREQRQHDSERSVDRADECLYQAVVHDLFEGRSCPTGEIFPDTVKDDDRIVNRKADHCEQGRHEQRIDFDAAQPAENGEDADDDSDIMQHRDDGSDSVEEGIVRVPEGPGDVEQDADRRQGDSDDRSVPDRRSEGRSDRFQAKLCDVAERGAERLNQLLLFRGTLFEFSHTDQDDIVVGCLDDRVIDAVLGENLPHITGLDGPAQLNFPQRPAGEIDAQTQAVNGEREQPGNDDDQRQKKPVVPLTDQIEHRRFPSVTACWCHRDL